jgi:dTDP-4-amino-4,6-dideoxygalactose transaminase
MLRKIYFKHYCIQGFQVKSRIAVNDPKLAERAEIIREKGTNRSQFFRGQIDKYTWVDIGSSYLPGEIIAAFLWAQMEEAESITGKRLDIWQHYHDALRSLDTAGKLRRPIIPDGCQHNAHMYYVLLDSLQTRTALMAKLREQGINSVFHYVPLHSAPAGIKYGRANGRMTHTDDLAERLLRLPLWIGLDKEKQGKVINSVSDGLTSKVSLKKTDE